MESYKILKDSRMQDDQKLIDMLDYEVKELFEENLQEASAPHR
jgi:hypothetical protein